MKLLKLLLIPIKAVCILFVSYCLLIETLAFFRYPPIEIFDVDLSNIETNRGLKTFAGAEFYPFVFYAASEETIIHNIDDFNTRSHELIHVEQVYRYGYVAVRLIHIYYNKWGGYWNNPLEIEAYAKEHL